MIDSLKELVERQRDQLSSGSKQIRQLTYELDKKGRELDRLQKLSYLYKRSRAVPEGKGQDGLSETVVEIIPAAGSLRTNFKLDKDHVVPTSSNQSSESTDLVAHLRKR